MASRIPKVAILTVTYGSRWHFLSKVLASLMADERVSDFVIVDNASSHKEEIEQSAHVYKNRVHIIRHEKNLGSAGGFSSGIEYARTLDCDYVLMLDDDNLPEEGAIDRFLEIKAHIAKDNIVLVGNRVNIPGNEAIFYNKDIPETEPKGTFFEPVSLKKVKHFLDLLAKTDLKVVQENKNPLSCVPIESFVYGGAFLPIEILRLAPLPDKNLILYGDDIEYSWGIKHLGYESYVCQSPKIYDLEMSFGEGSQVVGLFDPKTAAFKVYYRIRNMVRISVRNTKQGQVALFINIAIWVIALFVLGAIKYGVSKSYFKKVVLILRAVYGGYITTGKTPNEAKLP